MYSMFLTASSFAKIAAATTASAATTFAHGFHPTPSSIRNACGLRIRFYMFIYSL